MTKSIVFLAAVVVAAASIPILMAFPGFLGTFSNPNVACGSNAVADGGYNLADAGATVDGGYQIDPISGEVGGYVKVCNESTEPVYLGGPDVQPVANAYRICKTNCSSECSDDIPAGVGNLYCSASTETTPRILMGGP